MYAELPLFKTAVSWERLFDSDSEIDALESSIIPQFMKKCRWFGGKAKRIGSVAVNLSIAVKVGTDTHFFVILEVRYTQHASELYFLPLTLAPADATSDRWEFAMQSVVCRAETQDRSGYIIDSSYDRQFRDFLYANIANGVAISVPPDATLEFNAGASAALETRRIESRILKADQSNTAIIFNDKYFFKFYRKIEKEMNPDVELIRFLSERTNFRSSPGFAGSIEYRDQDEKTIVFGLLQQKVDNRGDAWGMTMDALEGYYKRVMSRANPEEFPALVDRPVLTFDESPASVRELLGSVFYESVVLLARRTAEMHMALASDAGDPAFAPEALSEDDLLSLHSSLRGSLRDSLDLLKNAMPDLAADVRDLGREVLGASDALNALFESVHKGGTGALKTRIHGDYHLGQVLFTGEDFLIIDFEGEPGLSFAERRLKKSPLKDVAGMMRSFHYAAYGKILLNENYRHQHPKYLDLAAEQWQHYVSRFFLGAYMQHMGVAGLSKDDEMLIRAFLLEKAIYELGYELNARPDWVKIPLKGIYYLVNRYMKG